MASTDQGWDVDDQVLPLQKAAAIPAPAPVKEAPKVDSRPPPGGRKGPPPLPPLPGAAGLPGPIPSSSPGRPSWTPPEGSVVRAQADMSNPGSLVDLLQARAAALEAAADKVGGARVQLELAIAADAVLGDEHRAAIHAENALKLNPQSSAAHGLLRRMKQGRPALRRCSATSSTRSGPRRPRPQGRAPRDEGAAPPGGGQRGPDAVAAWEQALALAPHHPAALKGLETELVLRRARAGRDAPRVGGALDAPRADGRSVRDRGAARGVAARRARAGPRAPARAHRHGARRPRAGRAARCRHRPGARRAACGTPRRRATGARSFACSTKRR